MKISSLLYKCRSHTENGDEIINSTNKKLNDLVFTSDLFKKVKKWKRRNITMKQVRKNKDFFSRTHRIYHTPLRSTIGTMTVRLFYLHKKTAKKHCLCDAKYLLLRC